MGELRPIERRVLKLVKAGVAHDEIARRFKRSPDHIARIADYAELPSRAARRHTTALRPLERRVLHLRGEGLDHGEIGRRFRRSPDHMRRIEGFALYKMARELLAP
jgi:DNA-binding CsgD family transcriptional regulator